MKASSGLDPSEYAGGGSLSSSFLEDSPFVSCGRQLLVCATTSMFCEEAEAWCECDSHAAAGE